MISSISGLVNMTPQKQVAYNASKGGLTMAAKVSLNHRSYLLSSGPIYGHRIRIGSLSSQSQELTSAVVGR